jgi:hypothetical protein
MNNTRVVSRAKYANWSEGAPSVSGGNWRLDQAHGKGLITRMQLGDGEGEGQPNDIKDGNRSRAAANKGSVR